MVMPYVVDPNDDKPDCKDISTDDWEKELKDIQASNNTEYIQDIYEYKIFNRTIN